MRERIYWQCPVCGALMDYIEDEAETPHYCMDHELRLCTVKMRRVVKRWAFAATNGWACISFRNESQATFAKRLQHRSDCGDIVPVYLPAPKEGK